MVAKRDRVHMHTQQQHRRCKAQIVFGPPPLHPSPHLYVVLQAAHHVRQVSECDLCSTAGCSHQPYQARARPQLHHALARQHLSAWNFINAWMRGKRAVDGCARVLVALCRAPIDPRIHASNQACAAMLGPQCQQ